MVTTQASHLNLNTMMLYSKRHSAYFMLIILGYKLDSHTSLTARYLSNVVNSYKVFSADVFRLHSPKCNRTINKIKWNCTLLHDMIDIYAYFVSIKHVIQYSDVSP